MKAGIVGVVLMGASIACTGSGSAGQPPPISVPDADPANAQAGGKPALRIGSIVNSAAPSLQLDRAVIEVLDQTIGSIESDRVVLLEVVTITDLADTASAVSALTELGVTVLITSCDSAGIPAVLETTAEVGLLAITGCPTIPKAAVAEEPGALTIHLAGLDDNAAAMAQWAGEEGHEIAATLRSTLVGDVDSTCDSFEERFIDAGGQVATSIGFTGLLDDPRDAIEVEVDALAAVDVIAVCALPGTVSDVVAALRAANLNQPILTPWFAEGEDWHTATSEVFVVTVASPHGDDPSAELNGMYASSDPSLGSTAAVAAEAVELLITVAESSNSVGSRSLDEAFFETTHDSYTGIVTIDDRSRRVLGRQYRVLKVADGRASFWGTIFAPS